MEVRASCQELNLKRRRLSAVINECMGNVKVGGGSFISTQLPRTTKRGRVKKKKRETKETGYQKKKKKREGESRRSGSPRQKSKQKGIL